MENSGLAMQDYLQSTKLLLDAHIYWNAQNVPPLTVTPSPDDLFAVKMKCRVE